jgi:amino acid adenylation domain-containing protein
MAAIVIHRSLRAGIDNLPGLRNSLAAVDLDDPRLFFGGAGNPDTVTPVESPAYVMYTSGSTGRPKGVVIQHDSLVNILYYLSQRYPLLPQDGYLLKTSFVFDVSVTELLGWFFDGGRLVVLAAEGHRDPYKMVDTVEREQITHINFVPSMFKALLDHLDGHGVGQISSLKYIFLAGEALVPELVKRFEAFSTGIPLEDLYGPTEGTIYASGYSLSNWQGGDRVPIGRPPANVQLYILDNDAHLQPVGIPGELCISGRGVARGYLNNPELTAEKFINLAAKAREGTRSPQNTKSQILTPKSYILYKTGDLCRFLPEGTIEFLGRLDQQVKIRGNRIELAEIESTLAKHESIKEVVVAARRDDRGGHYLCAFFTTPVSGTALVSRLREHLSRELPSYMVPSFFVPMDSLPLTPTGKIDRRSLPDVKIVGEEGREYGEAPADRLEIKMAEIWSDVLGIERDKIGREMNFFELGGHSLNGILLISKIHRAFAVRLSLADIFKFPVMRRLAQQVKNTVKDRYTPIEPLEAKEYYPLSSTQKRQYILHRMTPNTVSYNFMAFFELAKKPGRERLEGVFKSLIHRHESFRTCFRLVGEEPVQRVDKWVDFAIEYFKIPGKLTDESPVVRDATPSDTSVPDRSALGEIVGDFIRPFDLSTAPLLRVGLLYTGDDRCLLMVDTHHIVFDGISLAIFQDDLAKLYARQELPALKVQYKDFTRWQNRHKNREDFSTQESYWLAEFAAQIPVLNLPLDYPRPVIQSFEGDVLGFELGIKQTRGLKELALTENTTLFVVLLSLYYILLFRLSGQEDIVVGVPTAGRRHEALEHIVGMFVNTLALRHYPCGQKRYRAFLLEVSQCWLAAFENQDYPFEDLVEKAAVNRDPGRNPLFDVMFTFENRERRGVETAALGLAPYPFEYRIAKFDLVLNARQEEERLLFSLHYGARLFKADTVTRMSGYFNRIVDEVLAAPTQKIAGIELLSAVERRQLLIDFNDTSKSYPVDQAVHRFFEGQADKIPHHTALVDPEAGIFVSFSRLNHMANQLAARLRQEGVVPSSIVGLLAERSPGMVTGVLAILKTGGAYLPLEPGFPRRRVEYIVEDSQMAAIVIHRSLRAGIDNLPGLRNSLAAVDLDDPRLFFGDAGNPDTVTPVESPAYVMYTSGSTGRPKGVVIQHDSVVNILYYLSRRYPLLPRDGYLLKTSFVFDVSVTELLGWFFDGGRLVVLAAEGHRDPHKMVDTVEREQITHINFVPSMFKVFLDYLDSRNPAGISSLKYIFLAGEALVPELAERFEAFSTGIPLEDLYGPTEGTIYASGYSLSNWQGGDRVPIGHPLANVQLYILGNDAHLQPIGIPGELCISGRGVARGYLNNPELTAERFMNAAAKSREGTRSPHHQILTPKSYTLYKTGDLCRFLPEGTIEFLGRMDQQVKIRGNRIELAEIESQLLSHGKIKEAVVVMQEEEENGETYLAAFIVLYPGEGSVSQFREYLTHSLPEYMIPSYFVTLDRIPLTPGGKLDRSALPKTHSTRPDLDVEYMAPGTETERSLMEIWKDVLKLEKIGINDKFFDLGGNSLKFIQVNNRLRRVFNVDIPMIYLFRFPTIASLAGYLSNRATGTDRSEIEEDRSRAIQKGKRLRRQRIQRLRGQ